ncbi:hypothetical protein BpHYR1_023087 [Brachionus plicatilis]|uniref:Uncharacterized protein n=1 Tax=Brachionus plicatilis TaxID=10195 RepID=A0A3M7P2H9_BRAPC|nr:hypothetical protein BpHYR1_023087 [Brachionus plicatilis]
MAKILFSYQIDMKITTISGRILLGIIYHYDRSKAFLKNLLKRHKIDYMKLCILIYESKLNQMRFGQNTRKNITSIFRPKYCFKEN